MSGTARGAGDGAHGSRSAWVVYTDGGCHPNPGRGGWGVVLRSGGRTVRELSGGEEHTTNNRMELTAAIEALRALPANSSVDLHTDSLYLRKGITLWIDAWRRNGWRTAGRDAVKNQDLWQALAVEIERHEVRWHWVRGHAGNEHNERADALAAAAIRAGRQGAVPARPAADTVDLFCAVACSPVTGNGAWACVLRSGDARKTLRGFEADTTPNRLALLAVLSGLAALTRPGPVRVFCADDYVVEGATRWLRGWQQRGWRTSAGREVAHRELWEGLARRLGDHVVWVPTGGCAPPPLMREAKAAALAAVERTDGA